MRINCGDAVWFKYNDMWYPGVIDELHGDYIVVYSPDCPVEFLTTTNNESFLKPMKIWETMTTDTILDYARANEARIYGDGSTLQWNIEFHNFTIMFDFVNDLELGDRTTILYYDNTHPLKFNESIMVSIDLIPRDLDKENKQKWMWRVDVFQRQYFFTTNKQADRFRKGLNLPQNAVRLDLTADKSRMEHHAASGGWVYTK